MRVAILYPSSVESLDSERNWEKLVTSLALGLKSHEVDVVLYGSGDPESQDNLQLILPGVTKDDPQLVKTRTQIHTSELFEKATEFDIIHNIGGSLPLTYSGLTDTPIVSTINGISSAKTLALLKKYNQRTFYVSPSDSDRSTELNYIATVRHGVDCPPIQEAAESENLLYIGDISRAGGAADAVEIALKSRKKLVLCGKKPDNHFFNDFIEPFYKTEIDLITNCAPALKQKLISNASALIKPFGRTELFDLDLMEANIQGTPVIAYDSPWVREVIMDGVNGFIVSDVFGAIEAVSRLAEVSRDKCRRYAEEKFSTDRMVRDYLNVYQRILDSRKKEDRRPWGYYQVLSDAGDHKVKRIVVYPHRRLSLQRHRRRAEHWYVVSGTARVTLNADEIFLNAGEAINIGVGSLHRVCNPGDDPLVFIEVQIGDYFGEDDIERFEDDFGRCS